MDPFSWQPLCSWPPSNAQLGLGLSVKQAAQIQREVINKNLPPAETANQRIFVSFEGSPKTTRILQEKLRAKGFTVADDAASADARFQVPFGTYVISALAKQDIVGPLGEVLERTVQLDNKAIVDIYLVSFDWTGLYCPKIQKYLSIIIPNTLLRFQMDCVQ